ncbi:protein THEM6 [Drosophila serrata]|uniref:protein THEM6 n=1 Tax=Drosophila serrata TaxID=7274 RepID=UPI000A1D1CB4|nr:protein THEM6 [Drosophila serrata]XP_020805424.1 protein THEM6 [Drosophila serrata]XP_020805425.1 protein THEM6 [Drosophila serrata]
MEELLYLALGLLLTIVVLYGLLELHYFLRMCLCVVLARFIKRRCHILDATTVNGLCLTNDVDTLLYHMNNARYFREMDFARVDFYERTNLYRTITGMGGSVFQGAATIRYRRFIRPFHRFNIVSRIIYWDEQSLFMEHRFVRPSDRFVHCIAICRQRVIDVSMEAVMAELLPRTSSNGFRATALATPMPLPLSTGTGTVTGTGTRDQGGISNPAMDTSLAENGHATPTATNPSAGAGAGAAATAHCAKLKPSLPPELGKWIEYNDMSSKNLRSGC